MRSGNVSADFESYNPTSSRGWRKTNKIEIDAAKKTQESDLSQQTFNTSLTEEEMNSLASKILRAKIMKNDVSTAQCPAFHSMYNYPSDLSS